MTFYVNLNLNLKAIKIDSIIVWVKPTFDIFLLFISIFHNWISHKLIELQINGYICETSDTIRSDISQYSSIHLWSDVLFERYYQSEYINDLLKDPDTNLIIYFFWSLVFNNVCEVSSGIQRHIRQVLFQTEN